MPGNHRGERCAPTRIRLFILILLLVNGVAADVCSGQEGEFSVIRVGFDPNFPPFQYEQNGTYRGFTLDLLQAVADKEGFTYSLVPIKSREIPALLQQGEIDLVLGLNGASDLVEGVEFSESFFSSSISLVRRKGDDSIQNVGDLSEKIVALQSGTLEFEFLKNIRRLKVHYTSNQELALKLLVLDRADAFVGNRQTAEYYLERVGMLEQFEFVDNHVLPFELTMAIHQSRPYLLETINEGIRQIKLDGTYKRVYGDWFQDEQTLKKRLQHLVQGMMLFAALTVSVIFVGIRWNRRLQKQVHSKTKDLQLLNQTLAFRGQDEEATGSLKEQILDSSPRAIITCDREGVITSFNQKALDITGMESRPIGQSYTQIPLLDQFLRHKFRTVIEQESLFHGEEPITQPLAKREGFLRYYAYPLYDAKKHVIGLIFSFEDVTEERMVREQLYEQEKSRALTQLVAGLAHEIRNPLTSIKTFVQLIPHKWRNERFQQELVTHVPKEIERLNQLIENLMDYTKPRQMKRSRVDVAHLIESTLVLFKNAVEQKGFRIELQLEPSLMIYADGGQVKQVLINLLLNALEALEAKQQEEETAEGDLGVKIQTFEEKDAVVIQMIDEGIGMTEEEMQKAVEPFYTTKPKGTGLGLSLSKQYVQENNGSLTIHSFKRQGTTVTLRFRKEVKESGQNPGD